MDLNEAREQIDLIDDQMAKLFEKRMDLAKEIGTYKHDNNLPAVNRTREREIINRISNEIHEEYAGYSKTLFNMLFDLSRAYQNRFINPDPAMEREINEAIKKRRVCFPPRRQWLAKA